MQWQRFDRLTVLSKVEGEHSWDKSPWGNTRLMVSLSNHLTNHNLPRRAARPDTGSWESRGRPLFLPPCQLGGQEGAKEGDGKDESAKANV